MLIDEQFLNMASAQAKASPRLRMNYNSHQSLEDKCHRILICCGARDGDAIHRHIDPLRRVSAFAGILRSISMTLTGV